MAAVTLGTTDRMIGVSGTAWGAFVLVRSWLALSGRLPWRLMAFLDDAHERGILRQSGPLASLKQLLLEMPDVGDDRDFERPDDRGRAVEL